MSRVKMMQSSCQSTSMFKFMKSTNQNGKLSRKIAINIFVGNAQGIYVTMAGHD